MSAFLGDIFEAYWAIHTSELAHVQAPIAVPVDFLEQLMKLILRNHSEHQTIVYAQASLGK